MENEDRIRTHATAALHEKVEQVLGMLGVDGWFGRRDYRRSGFLMVHEHRTAAPESYRVCISHVNLPGVG